MPRQIERVSAAEVAGLHRRIAELEAECRDLRDLASVSRAGNGGENGQTSQALQRQLFLFARAEEVSRLGHYEWDLSTGQCLSCSAGLRSLLGVDHAFCLDSQTFLKIVHPEDHDRYLDVTTRHRRTGQTYEIVYRIRQGDGAVRHLREVGQPMPVVDGESGRWFATLLDITGEPAVEGAVSDRRTLPGSFEGVAVVESGRLVHATPSLAAILGYDDPDELIALDSVDSLIAAPERARLKGYWAAQIKGEPAPERYTAQYLRRGGLPIWLESVVQTITWDGEPAVQITLIDISRHIERQAALEASEQRFKDFAGASSDWFWEMGTDLRFSWLHEPHNDRPSLASGLIGKTRWDLAVEDLDAPAWRKHRADLRSRRPFTDFRYRRRDAGGNLVYVSVSGVPIFDAQGEFQGYRGTSSDITAQVRTEQEVAEAQALLASAVESVSDGFSLFDQDGRLVLCNDGFRQRYGGILEQLGPRPYWGDIFRRLIESGVLEAPTEDLDDWIEEQVQLYRTVGATAVQK
ncbi:MAG: PAS domain S-box protein [Pseudomonadota bacterium]